MTKQTLLERISEVIDLGASEKEINVLVSLYKSSNKIPSNYHEIVLNVVFDYFTIDKELFFTSNRKRKNTDARKIVSIILRHNGYTYQKIGNIINRDHSNIIYLVKEGKVLLSYDKHFEQNYKSIKRLIDEEAEKYKLQ